MGTKPARPLRILVVDDNQDAAELLGDFLGASGHEIRVAFDGTTAIDAAGGFSPDLILLDIGLPGLDGYEVARTLADRGCDATLVALTGYGQDRDRDLAAQAGFAHHLLKPVDLDRLLGIVATLST